MVITHVVVDGRPFLLDGTRQLVEVMSQIEEAARTQPTFVDVSGSSGMASVLVSSNTKIVVTVARDELAQGAHAEPFIVPPGWDV